MIQVLRAKVFSVCYAEGDGIDLFHRPLCMDLHIHCLRVGSKVCSIGCSAGSQASSSCLRNATLDLIRLLPLKTLRLTYCCRLLLI